MLQRDSQPSLHILQGIDELIVSQLGNLKHGTMAKRLDKPPQNFSARELLDAMIAEIEKNLQQAWHLSQGDTPKIVLGKSTENWRNWRPQQKHDIRKPERELEHRLADAGADDPDWTWWNQMPIASGLVGYRADRTRAIDLICKRNDTAAYYRLIELKVNRSAGAPLAALIEILCYGLVYFVLRKNRNAEWLKHLSLDSSIFTALRIDLCVLAPKKYYDGYQLDWLERGLSQALNEIIAEKLGEVLVIDLSSYWPKPFEIWELKDEKKFQEILEDNEALKSILKDWNSAYAG